MSPTEEHLKRIQDKLQQLLKQHAVILKENNKLKDELLVAREGSLLQQKNMEELKQQVSVLKLGAGDMTEGDKKEFEKRINGYIKEIDRCIAEIGG